MHDVIKQLEESVNEVSSMIASHGEMRAPAPDEGNAARLAVLSGKLKPLDLAVVWKRGTGQGTSWEIECTDGRHIVIGDGDSLFNFKRVRAAVLNATKKVLPYRDRWSWDEVVKLIAEAAIETNTVSEEEDTSELVRAFTAAAWNTALILDETNMQVKYRVLKELREHNGWASLGDGRIAIRGFGLYRELTVRLAQKLSYRELGLRLSRIGFKPERLQARDSDKTIAVRVWISPEGWASSDAE